MDSFSARLNASEGSYFLTEQQNSVKRHIQKLVDQGALPKSFLEKVGDVPAARTVYDVPLTVIKSRPVSERVFSYNGVPVPQMSASEAWARMGTSRVSLGSAKWSAEGASIFSVADGKKLAQEPAKLPSQWELNRQRKIAKAAIDPRVVNGFRLMPEYTPARALLWGTILAMWGTGAVVATASKGLDIHTTKEASLKLKAAAQPMVDFMSTAFAPVKGWFNQQEAHESVTGQLVPFHELARRMRSKLGHEQHS